MSCNDIGNGMNSVVRKVITLMDDGQISKDSARKIVSCCAGSVANWCDGSRVETVNYIRNCLCGRCMKKIPKGERMYSLYCTSSEAENASDMIYDLELASDCLCQECFDEVLNGYCNDSSAGERERKYIEEQNEECISTGKYEETNNGHHW